MRRTAVNLGVALVGLVVTLGAALGQGGGAKPASPELPPELPPALPVVTKVLVIEPCLRSLRSAMFIDPVEHALATGAFKPPAAGDVVAAPAGTSADIGGAGVPKPAEARTWRWLEAKAEPPADPTAPADPSDPGSRPVAVAGAARFEDPALMGGYAFVTVTSPTRRVVMLDAAGHRHVYVSSSAEGGAGPMTWTPRVGDVYENGLVRVPIVLEPGETHLLFRAGRGGLKIGFKAAPAEPFIVDADPTLPTILRDEPGLTRYQAAVVVVNPTEEWARDYSALATLGSLEGGGGAIAAIPPLGIVKAPLTFAGPAGLGADTTSIDLRMALGRGKIVSEARTFKLDVRSRHEKHTRTFTSAIDGSVQYFAVVPPKPAVDASMLGTTPVVGQAFENTAKKLALILSLHGASVEATNQAAAYAPKDWAWIVCPTNRRPFGFDWEDWGRLDAMEVLAEACRLFDPDPRKLYLTGHSMGGHGTWQLAVTYPGLFAAIAPSAGWPDFWSYTGAGEWPGDDPVRAALRRGSAPSRTLELADRLKGTPIYILHGDKDDNVPVAMARTMVGKLATHEDLAYHEQPGASHWWGNECVDWPALMEFFKARTLKGEPIGEFPDVPISAGGFKDAFRHGSVLVYGSRGSPEENAWALAKVRFDSETFLYRGNASLRVMSDDEFLAHPGHAELGAVFYGNERINGAWAKLAGASQLEGRTGPGLGVLGIVARRDGARRAGLVGGADVAGMRLTNQTPYFVSGVAYPEWFVFGPEALLTGVRGVREARWFSGSEGNPADSTRIR